MKTVLVTGGCGFIGSHFIRLLLTQKTWRVVNVDKLSYAGSQHRLRDVEEGYGYRFAHGDIIDRGLLDTLFTEERPWAVVNFAAESHVDRSILDPSLFLMANVLGVDALLEAARRHPVERFVQISTDEVYGDADGREPFREDSLLRPSSPYAASKAAADLLCLASWRTYGVPVLIARSCNNYGPFQFPEKLIPLVIRNALAGDDLPVYGDGQQRREWLYVEDNTQAILRILVKGTPGTVYNVSAAEERTNLEVVRAICKLLAEEGGLGFPGLLQRIRFVTDRPGHDRRYSVQADRVREELEWHPAVPSDVGLRRTVRWYLENQQWLGDVTSSEYQSYYETVYRRAWGQKV